MAGPKHRSRSSSSKLSFPAGLRELFEFSNLMPNEKPEFYEELFRAVAEAIQPKDIVECLLIRRFVDHTLDNHRYQQLMTLLLGSELEMPTGPKANSDPGYDHLREVAERFEASRNLSRSSPEIQKKAEEDRRRRQKEAERERQERQKEAERERQKRQKECDRSRTPAEVTAAMTRAFQQDAAVYERLSRLAEIAEQSRTAALRQIARHRQSLTFAHTVSKVVDNIIDAEFKETSTSELKSIAGK